MAFVVGDQEGVFRETAIVGVHSDNAFDLLDSSAWLEVVVGLFMERLEVGSANGSKQLSEMDEVKLDIPGRLLLDIVDFIDAVGSCPWLWRREEVNTTNSDAWKFVRCSNRPSICQSPDLFL